VRDGHDIGGHPFLVTGFLWVTGAILHWHNIKRQERLLDRMQLMSAPQERAAYRGRGRREAVPAAGPDERITAGAARW
jgi:hypothetical protein